MAGGDEKKTVDQRPQRGWERPPMVRPQATPAEYRDTFRVDAPSPCEEILAQHDADLQQEDDDDENCSDEFFCF